MGVAGIAVLPGVVVEVLRAGCTDRGYVDGLGSPVELTRREFPYA